MANSWSDSISEIDTATLALVRTLPAGFEPNSVITDLAARFLYVANRVSNDISVIDLKSGTELKRLAAGRGASYLERSPDGASIYCTHIYPYPGKFRTPPESDIAVIDTARQTVRERYPLPNAAGVFHVALVGRRPPGNGRTTPSQEPDPAGPRRARVGLRQLDFGLRPGRSGRSRAGPAR